MKKLLIFTTVLVTTCLNAQFDISGSIKNYPLKPILIKIYDNGNERAITRIETDQQGNFKYHYPAQYTGKIIFELSNGAFESIVDNADLKFSTDLNDPKHEVVYQSGINKQIKEAFELEDKKSLRDYTLVELQKLYKSTDDFYIALQKEISRIDNLNPAEFNNEAIQYYVNAKNELAQFNGNAFTSDEIMQKSKQHLVMDNMYLENFGLLQEYISQYISYAISGAKNKEEASVKIENALDELLGEAQTETSRGQAILTNIIPMLSGNGFDDLANKYLSQAESLTCEITDELKNLIAGKSNVKIGATVPNIKFGNKLNGAKSLYDVKANQKLLIFWASWCPHCMSELPHIKTFYPEFKAKGGEIIAISLDMEQEPYLKAVKDAEYINYSDFLKWESPLVSQFGVSSTPTMILLDKDNKVVKIGSRITEFL